MSLFAAYRTDRNNGLTHAEIADIYGPEANEFSIRYSQELAIYADYMSRQECDNRGDLDVFGAPLKAGS